MADNVDAVQGPADRHRVADVTDDQFGLVWPVRRPPVVHGGGERVHAADLMAGREHRVHHMRADEARGSGDQYAHVA